MDQTGRLWPGFKIREGLFASSYGKMIDPLVVKDSFLRKSHFSSQKVANRPPAQENAKNISDAVTREDV